MTNQRKLNDIRDIMKDSGLGGFIVPRTDEYLGEYVPACAERLAWLTGFTGSAGGAVILEDKAVVMSDGRYTIQLVDQVDSTLYEVANSQEKPLAVWLKENLPDGSVIGYDPKLHTADEISRIETQGVTLKAVSENFVDRVWQDKPSKPLTAVTLFPEKYAGRASQDKIADIQAQLKEQGADAVLVTMSDSIAWLLNIRGNDIPFIPVALSYAIVPVQGKVQWFINPDKVKDITLDYVELFNESDVSEQLKTYRKVWVDEKRTPIYFKNILKDNNVTILNKEDPCLMPRACKTVAEQAAMKQAHIRDGVALVKFLKWFEEEAPKGELTELSVEEKLEGFRAVAPEFKEPSFTTIAGYGANGAIVHYRATQATNKTIKSGSLLLLDSGAQYRDGTTDVTRTILIGDVEPQVKENNTLVFKGHIGLARAVFKKGTLGKELDKLARSPLQSKGLNYAHGTGHGVGCYLSVHEESAGISPRGERGVEAGMIISNEPGYYEEGEYGIRIESLVLAKEVDDATLCFETITLAPIDKNLIVIDMLNQEEISWLNNYHQQVFETLSPLLDEEHKNWLREATSEM